MSSLGSAWGRLRLTEGSAKKIVTVAHLMLILMKISHPTSMGARLALSFMSSI